MWQEVVSNKKAHEDPVIYAPLKVEGKRQAGHGQLSGEVLKTWEESRIDFFGQSLLITDQMQAAKMY